jgi:hypothetical protein
MPNKFDVGGFEYVPKHVPESYRLHVTVWARRPGWCQGPNGETFFGDDTVRVFSGFVDRFTEGNGGQRLQVEYKGVRHTFFDVLSFKTSREGPKDQPVPSQDPSD